MLILLFIFISNVIAPDLSFASNGFAEAINEEIHKLQLCIVFCILLASLIILVTCNKQQYFRLIRQTAIFILIQPLISLCVIYIVDTSVVVLHAGGIIDESFYAYESHFKENLWFISMMLCSFFFYKKMLKNTLKAEKVIKTDFLCLIIVSLYPISRLSLNEVVSYCGSLHDWNVYFDSCQKLTNWIDRI